MSKLELYYDKKCTKAIPIVNGEYSLELESISSNVTKKPTYIWMKNIGSHTAYGVFVSSIDGTLINITCPTSIKSGEVGGAIIYTDTRSLINETKSFKVRIEYDSI